MLSIHYSQTGSSLVYAELQNHSERLRFARPAAFRSAYPAVFRFINRCPLSLFIIVRSHALSLLSSLARAPVGRSRSTRVRPLPRSDWGPTCQDLVDLPHARSVTSLILGEGRSGKRLHASIVAGQNGCGLGLGVNRIPAGGAATGGRQGIWLQNWSTSFS